MRADRFKYGSYSESWILTSEQLQMTMPIKVPKEQ